MMNQKLNLWEKTMEKRSGCIKTLKQKSSTSVVGDRKDQFFLGKTSADIDGFLGIFEFLIFLGSQK